MNRRRYIIPLIWLAVTLLALAAGLVTSLLPLHRPGPHPAVYVLYSPGQAVQFLAPLAVFTAAAWIIDAGLQLAYRRWLAWAHLGLILSGAAAIYLIPAIVTRVFMAGATVGDVIAAYKASAPVETAGFFAAWAGLVCFVAMLISIVIRAWTYPRPN